MCNFTDFKSIIYCVVGFFEARVIPILVGFMVLVFLWGIIIFIKDGGDEAKRTEGKQFMFWGIIGLSFMFCVWALVSVLTGTGVFVPQIKVLDKVNQFTPQL
jgi:uncharacterized membrane protein